MRRRAVPIVLAVAALAGCGGDDARPAAPAPADRTRLSVEVTGAGPEPVRFELRCGATQPCRPAQVDRLAAIAEPPDPGRACTLQYGGPERAHVTGTLQGRPVDVTVARSDGCGIADYEALFAALGREPPLAG